PTPTDIYTLSLHDALPICRDTASSNLDGRNRWACRPKPQIRWEVAPDVAVESKSESYWHHCDHDQAPPPGSLQSSPVLWPWLPGDRKSTRLNSSHVKISYA